MADPTDKKPAPPYVSYSSFKSFLKGLGESTVPSRIDKTVMSNYSGSTQYALFPALQWCGLIEKDGTPKPLLHQLATAKDGDYSSLLVPMVKEKYAFLFNENIDLEKASSGQVIEAFKSQDIQGTTVTKSMAFFLAMAKDAKIKVSSHVKAPTVPRSPKKKRKAASTVDGGTTNDQRDPPTDTPPADMVRIPVPLKDMENGVVIFPEGMTDEQARKAVKMAVFILNEYYEIG